MHKKKQRKRCKLAIEVEHEDNKEFNSAPLKIRSSIESRLKANKNEVQKHFRQFTPFSSGP